MWWHPQPRRVPVVTPTPHQPTCTISWGLLGIYEQFLPLLTPPGRATPWFWCWGTRHCMGYPPHPGSVPHTQNQPIQ